MSTSIWGGPESHADDNYPLSLLKYLIKQMMERFSAQGACLALLDNRISQMRMYLHVRLRSMSIPPSLESAGPHGKGIRFPVRRPGSFSDGDGHGRGVANGDELEEISPQQCEFFAPGTSYTINQDLIGYGWSKREAYVMRHEEYLANFYDGQPLPFKTDIVPSSYLVVPVQETTLVDEMRGRKSRSTMLGVIVLYRLKQTPDFHSKQLSEAVRYVERIALYLQNDYLQRSQQRSSEYLEQLQDISAAFPTSVKLSDLVEAVYQFTSKVVNVSSMLLTLYDRDTEKIYDVFAVWNGTRIDGLVENPVSTEKDDRSAWWKVTQVEKKKLQFSPARDQPLAKEYKDLLIGVWGDQFHAESFLLLPMKMFNRVTGSLCITSKLPRAYPAEVVQVLETMVQIVTVSIENARLYERDRHLLQEARQREAQLAAINSALQSISSVLNVNELLKNLVESVAEVVNVKICVFFQLSPDRDELVAQALYGPTSVRMVDDGSGLPEIDLKQNKAEHEILIKMIRLPFKRTFLEQRVNEGFFYLDTSELEDLAQNSPEGYSIFLQETNIRQMLMIPLTYQTEFFGVLAVPTPNEHRFFRPKEIGTLLAITAQAVGALRNAQLFAQREETNAELERLNKLKDEFLVTASHELRTPLSAIIGYSSLLKRHSQGTRISPQQVLRFANKIAGASQQLHDLVDNMTEAARMGADDKKLNIEPEPVQILSAAEVAANMLAFNIEQKITLDVDPNLWVNGSPVHFRQVLSNLLENAAKYSPPNGMIYLSCSAMTLAQVEDLFSEDQMDHQLLLEHGDMQVVLMRVRDQGEGILPADQQRIFEKFVRAPRSLTTPVRGSGLGLYICRRYIEAMGGKLWLEQSTPNEGSTFSFYLPRVKPLIEVRETDEREQYTE